MAKTSLVLLMVLLGLASFCAAQNCGCSGGNCCSKFGYCGTGNAYCGDGCREGPCYSGGGGGGGGGGSVASVVTDAFFNGIMNRAGGGCAGKSFYTRSAFLAAARAYPSFGTAGSSDVQKREIAAFFAHVTHETAFCYIEEINGATRNYCDPSNRQWPCNPNKKYHGRGPIQISWNYNYGPAGRDIGFDGLNSPETVSSNPTIAFKTALWFWSNNVHSIIASGQGFGPTIRAINGMECNGGNSGAVNARVQYFTQYCQQLGVSPAGRDIGFDGLNSPETVSSDPTIAFKTALWFWSNNVHSIIASGQGFGPTIRAINGMECNGGNSGAVNARVQCFTQYCQQLGVSPGGNLSC
ncbi:hypothetical protein V2J09_005018 [Rumex salicifolius]